MVITKVYRDNYTRELPTYIIAKRNAYQFGKKMGQFFKQVGTPLVIAIKIYFVNTRFLI